MFQMSKSNPNEGSRINLLDPPDVQICSSVYLLAILIQGILFFFQVIANKIKRCKTDSFVGLVAFSLSFPLDLEPFW